MEGAGVMGTTRILLASLSAAFVASSAQAQEPASYGWNAMDDGAIVQFGVPDTDDRAIRLDCAGKGRIGIMGPADTDEPEGAKIVVTLTGRAGAKRHAGEVIDMGDGSNFSVAVAPTDDAIATLLAGRDLTLVVGKDEWSVPGKGAARLLKPLLAICATR
jgi:hypothetical protein